ncbi:hypothetical protein Q8A73_005440 [Channa argus]|nr:hypothetical protein Q8A73_005440 [Channa argus]
MAMIAYKASPQQCSSNPSAAHSVRVLCHGATGRGATVCCAPEGNQSPSTRIKRHRTAGNDIDSPYSPMSLYGSRLKMRCSCSSSSGLAGKEATGTGLHCLSAGMELVSWACFQLFGPLPARWRVVATLATLSARASLAALLCSMMEN